MTDDDVTATDPAGLLPHLDLDRAYVFCDFDGTLVEIAATPDGITIPTDLAARLNALATRLDGRFAIVTGRPVGAIDRFLPDYRGDIWGAHGASSRRDGTHYDHLLTDGPEVAALHAAMDRIGQVHDALLEKKPTGAVVHFRDNPRNGAALREAVEAMLADHADFELHASKMAWEVRPDDASKGGVVDHVLAAWGTDLLPVVFGDDTTDEEGMAVARRHGGFGVRIGAGETLARFRLPDPTAMRALVMRLTEGALT